MEILTGLKKNQTKKRNNINGKQQNKNIRSRFCFYQLQRAQREENYADLLSKVPWAKRIHGVEGFDSAHKAAAELAETDFFIL